MIWHIRSHFNNLLMDMCLNPISPVCVLERNSYYWPECFSSQGTFTLISLWNIGIMDQCSSNAKHLQLNLCIDSKWSPALKGVVSETRQNKLTKKKTDTEKQKSRVLWERDCCRIKDKKQNKIKGWMRSRTLARAVEDKQRDGVREKKMQAMK